MRLRKLFAGLAAAATLLGGLTLGVGSAFADEATGNEGTTVDGATTNEKLPVLGTTLTIKADKAEQFQGHTFALYDLAWYVPVSGSETIELQTSSRPYDSSYTSNKYDEIRRAMAVATKDNASADDQYATEWNDDGTPKTYRDDDPFAWAAQPDLTEADTDTNGRIDQSPTSPWFGITRKLAEALDITKLSTPMKTVTIPSNYTPEDENDPSYVISGLPAGIYLIVDTTSSADNATWSNSLRMVVGTALKIKVKETVKELSTGEIQMKNQTLPIHKQVVKPSGDGYVSQTKPDYSIGDTITYELTSTLPSYTGYDKPGRVYQIVDTMSQGLTFDKVVSVKVGTGKMTPTTLQQVGTDTTDEHKGDYTVTYEGVTYDAQQPNHQVSDVNGKAGTKIVIDLSNYVNETNNATELMDGGATVTVIITATLNKQAVISAPGNALGNPNKVDLVYSNNPEDVSDKTTTPGGEVNVYTFKFQIKKIDKETKKPLAGAEFIVQGPDRLYLQKRTVGKDGFEWAHVDKEQATHFVSDANGMIEGLDGLDAGTYTVIEVAPPSGYQSTLMPSFSFTINPEYERDGSTMPDSASEWGDHMMTQVSFSSPSGDLWNLVSQGDNQTAPEFQYTVVNVKNVTELPLTGGAGIILFGVIGLVLAGGAALVFVWSRRTKMALTMA
ncbi:isopeptide-forming domain-containing fimbrial protein [Bifidobacterium amazonense]|uniref:Isopeptide-forming domain-containing fimbrial protein n=1 Tax=Bifidobacterium amazonense TaxID=2809027 RepID=A0ABS9VSH5_9BIFI|nr:isopeptide-forming domain-containing fimbrial protein [Bifidobacterium amazonense]MCH9274911.1 isopeptide-forming domain-containing fimbrial protein [Bifidobacterium amazonense]